MELKVQGLRTKIDPKTTGQALAAQWARRLSSQLDEGKDATGRTLPDISESSQERRANRYTQWQRHSAGIGNYVTALRAAKEAARKTHRKAKKPRTPRDAKWLIRRFVNAGYGGKSAEPDGLGTPGRESGFLAQGLTVRYMGGQSGSARVGVFLPKQRHEYVRWAQDHNAVIADVPSTMLPEIEAMLRRQAEAIVGETKRVGKAWMPGISGVVDVLREAGAVVDWALL